jgi:hypothetical protein
MRLVPHKSLANEHGAKADRCARLSIASLDSRREDARTGSELVWSVRARHRACLAQGMSSSHHIV